MKLLKKASDRVLTFMVVVSVAGMATLLTMIYTATWLGVLVMLVGIALFTVVGLAASREDKAREDKAAETQPNA